MLLAALAVAGGRPARRAAARRRPRRRRRGSAPACPRELRDRVELLGQVSDADKARLLRCVDVYCAPEHRRRELRHHPARGDGRRAPDRGQRPRRRSAGCSTTARPASCSGRGPGRAGAAAGSAARRPGAAAELRRRRARDRRAVRLDGGRAAGPGGLRDGRERRRQRDALRPTRLGPTTRRCGAAPCGWLVRGRAWPAILLTHAWVTLTLHPAAGPAARPGRRRAGRRWTPSWCAGPRPLLELAERRAARPAGRCARRRARRRSGGRRGEPERRPGGAPRRRERPAAGRRPRSPCCAGDRRRRRGATSWPHRRRRVQLARRFHNDAVRDDPRAARAAASCAGCAWPATRAMPQLFEIDDEPRRRWRDRREPTDRRGRLTAAPAGCRDAGHRAHAANTRHQPVSPDDPTSAPSTRPAPRASSAAWPRCSRAA